MVTPNEDVAPTNAPVDSADTGVVTKDPATLADSKAAAYAALGAGKRHLLVADAESAVASLGEACQLFAAEFGETAVECGEAYLYYGKALLELARLESGVFGDKMGGEGKEEESGDENEEENGDAEDEGKEAEAVKDDANDGETNETEEEGDDDEPTNLQLAWEMLELAKVVYNKQVTEASAESKEDVERKLCDTLLTLGEVSVENENYGQAEEDFLSCLKLQVASLPADNRNIAESHYQLGIAQGFAMKYEEAIESLNSAITVLDTRVKNLKNKSENPDSATSKEILELEALIPEIKEKITDTKEMKEENLKKMRASVGLPGSSSNGAGSSSGAGAGPSGATANEAKPVSSIAIKRKTTTEEVDPKKPKDA